MKLLHLADLHFGKTLHQLSLIEDQAFWCNQLLDCIDREKPDAVVIAGDVYDRSVPSKEAVTLLSSLLTSICDREIPVMLIAGNHDGGERLDFASSLLGRSGLHIAGTAQAEMAHFTYDFKDGFGPVTFWLMPYVFPAAVREALGLTDDQIGSYTEAVRALLAAQAIDMTQRNVLIAHQTVFANGHEPIYSDSETAIGGVGGIDASVFEGFDYVALGHIHGAQPAGKESIRYAGSPLCYHFSEAGQKKGPLFVTLNDKGEAPVIRSEEFQPLHRVRPTMIGTLDEIMKAELFSHVSGEYVRVVLTDEWVPPETSDKLRALFESHGCRLLDISRESKREYIQTEEDLTTAEEISLDEHFLRYYRHQTRQSDPGLEEARLIRNLAGMISEDLDADTNTLAEKLVKLAMKEAEQ